MRSSHQHYRWHPAAALLTLCAVVSSCAEGKSSLDVTLVGASPEGTPGGRVELTAQTKGGAVCDLVVLYPSGPSRAAGLIPQTVDDAGRVTWDWNIDSDAPFGTHSVFVQCHMGDLTGGAVGQLEVSPH
jgi:hypothetical protein